MVRIPQQNATAPAPPPGPTVNPNDPAAVFAFLKEQYFYLRDQKAEKAGVEDARDYTVDEPDDAIKALHATLQAMHRHEDKPAD